MPTPESDPQPVGTIWVLNLDELVSKVEPSVAATFRRITEEHISELPNSTLGRDAIDRLNAGKHCYSAWVDGQLAAYAWVSFVEEHIGELNLRIMLLPGEIYIWDCATAPEFRGKHLYSALLSHIIQEFCAQGFCRAWIGADLENVISQKGMSRAGFHHVADLFIKRVVAIRQVWVQGLPDVREQIIAEARRVFLNDRSKIWRDAATLAQR